MQTTRLLSFPALFVIGLASFTGCGGIEEDEQPLEESTDAVCAGFGCRPGREVGAAPNRPDLVPEIASGFPDGFACPVGNGNTVSVRVRNQGNATAGTFVVRTEVTIYTGTQYYTVQRHYLQPSLSPGGQSTIGINLGDGVNPAPGSDGVSTPSAPIQFFNGVGSNWSQGTYVTSWRVTVDTSMGVTWYPWGSSYVQISYPNNAISESNESNNVIQGTRTSCGFASGLVLSQ